MSSPSRCRTWASTSARPVPGRMRQSTSTLARAGITFRLFDASSMVGARGAPGPPTAPGMGGAGGPPSGGGSGAVGARGGAATGGLRPPQTMMLSDADKAAVDTVCAAARRCVMVVVSGRPLIIDRAQRNELDGLVAAWLPGSEGAGVADTLFGTRPFTGRLPMTWPRSIDQEPINVGDRH